MVHTIVEPRQTLPILANVLLETAGELLRITATDLEVGVRVSVPAKAVKDGGITLSARKLLEIVKELPQATLTLRVQENAWVALRCAGAAYKLVGLTLCRRLLERPASESGRLCHADGGHEWGDRRRRVLMLPTLPGPAPPEPSAAAP